MTSPLDVAECDIHTMFGLSHSNYLVIEDVAYQAMPADWHTAFRSALQEYNKAKRSLSMPGRYWALAAQAKTYDALTEAELRRLKVSDLVDEEVDARLNQDGSLRLCYCDPDGRQREGWEEVLVPDPDDDLVDAAPFRMVFPRTILQSMPAGWQHRFVRLMHELNEAGRSMDLPTAYRVQAQDRVNGEWVDVLDPVPHYDRGRARVELAANR